MDAGHLGVFHVACCRAVHTTPEANRASACWNGVSGIKAQRGIPYPYGGGKPTEVFACGEKARKERVNVDKRVVCGIVEFTGCSR